MSVRIQFDEDDICYLDDGPGFYKWVETLKQPRFCKAWGLYVTAFKDVNNTLGRGNNKRWLEYHDLCGVVAHIPVPDKLFGCGGQPIIYTEKRRNGTRIR